ncbi:YeiH family protein [Falsihalocynthiibacter sp. SS001]|uniref:YeiH family protein n=1 Tax=Falsihalocynthiibacter sp. SS001 TaxID=3349698 RepID=UPI0036D40C07
MAQTTKTSNGQKLSDFRDQAREIGPGLLLAGMVAMAAQFLSEHYGIPVMLMAILLGMPLQFLSEDGRAAPGITFASRTVLRIGVALLGMSVSGEMVMLIGPTNLVLILLSVAATILLSIAAMPLIGKDRLFGFLTGGSVAICGASAAMAISSILPNRPENERDLSFTVISITLMSTLAMILYPVISEMLGLDTMQAGLFLGGTIHDVAQVVGAGYSVSDEVGEISTLVKLFRVALLAPVVFIGALALRRSVPAGAARPPLMPLFVVGFLVLAALNSFHLIPEAVKEPTGAVSRAMLVAAVAAVGMKTSLAQLRSVGAASMLIIFAQTVFLGVLILGAIYMAGPT